MRPKRPLHTNPSASNVPWRLASLEEADAFDAIVPCSVRSYRRSSNSRGKIGPTLHQLLTRNAAALLGARLRSARYKRHRAANPRKGGGAWTKTIYRKTITTTGIPRGRRAPVRSQAIPFDPADAPASACTAHQ